MGLAPPVAAIEATMMCREGKLSLVVPIAAVLDLAVAAALHPSERQIVRAMSAGGSG